MTTGSLSSVDMAWESFHHLTMDTGALFERGNDTFQVMRDEWEVPDSSTPRTLHVKTEPTSRHKPFEWEGAAEKPAWRYFTFSFWKPATIASSNARRGWGMMSWSDMREGDVLYLSPLSAPQHVGVVAKKKKEKDEVSALKKTVENSDISRARWRRRRSQ